MSSPDPYDRCKHGRQFCVSCHYDEPKKRMQEQQLVPGTKPPSELERKLTLKQQELDAAIDLLARLVQLQKDDCEIRGGIPTRWQPLLDEADAIIKSKAKP